MATVNRVVDDFNPELDASTRTFELMGQKYEIDVADENMSYFDEMVVGARKLLETARPVNGRSEPKIREGGISSNRGSGVRGKSVSVSRKKSAKVTATRKPTKNTRAKKAVDGAPPAVVRKWAQSNGVEVSATGVIQQSTYDAYNAAHTKDGGKKE